MTDDLPLRVTALRLLSDLMRDQYKAAREEMQARMKRGERFVAVSPLDEDVKLGSVTRVDPKRTARVEDRGEFLAWVRSTYPGNLKHETSVVGSDREVIAVLREHAPKLLARVTKVDSNFERLVMAISIEAGAAVGPGGEVDVPGVVVETPEAYVACRPEKGALAEVIELFRRDALTLDSLARPELPSGDDVA